MFDDILEANRRPGARPANPDLAAFAARGLAVVTCIDSRIDPLAILGLVPGDAKIIRNAGARVTPDVLRSLVLATALLGVDRICLVQHTNCALGGTTDEVLGGRVTAARGIDVTGMEFLASSDQLAAIRDDVRALRSSDLLPGVEVGGFLLDIRTGFLTPVDVDSDTPGAGPS